MGSLALVILELRKAPKGYEDECGFHAVHRVRWGTLSPVQDKECSRSRTIRHPAIKNDSGAILRFSEIALVLVRLDHVARRDLIPPAPASS